MEVLVVLLLTVIVLLLLALVLLACINHFKIKQLMADVAQFQAVIDRIDGATNNIAGDLRTIKEQLEGAGLSAELEAEILAKLDSAATKLEAVAAETPEQPAEE